MQKHGLDSFVLVIFKILGKTKDISVQNLQQAEDVYLKLIIKKYNFLDKAYTSLGYKHTKESKEKIRQKRLGTSLSSKTKEKLRKHFSGEFNPLYGKKHSFEFKEKLSNQRKGFLNPMFGKLKSKEFLLHANKVKTGKHNYMSKPVQLTHVITNQVLKFESQIEAALYFNYKTKFVIVKAIQNQTLFLNTWEVNYMPSKKPSLLYFVLK